MCEEFLEVVTCAVAIDWPTKKQDVHLKSDLDVLNDVYTKVLRLWNKPYSALLLNPTVTNYSNIRGLNEQSYGAMSKVEQTLANYLSSDTASILKPRYYPLSHAEQLQLSVLSVRLELLLHWEARTCRGGY